MDKMLDRGKQEVGGLLRIKPDAFTRARIRAGLSQRALGRAIGKSSGYISLVERQKLGVSPKAAKQICEVLGVDLEAIFVLPSSGSETA